MADLPEISVQPGQIYLARRPSILHTILGSCVSATFWSRRMGVGGLSHGVLPRCPHGAGRSEIHRYVDSSIRYLAEQFDSLGVPRQEVEVKLFGGADVLPVTASKIARPTIGSLNCQIARQVLEEEGFQVLASDLGGTQGRTIDFHTGTGEVLLFRLATLVVAADRVHVRKGVRPHRGF